uniref:Uncharacterized protein n=1 Tax=Knipowitschia caucasica TaxID=637954 RepID=A0AAV2JK05_KNICA
MDTRLLFLFLGVHYVCAGQVLLPAPLLIADKEALTEADVVEFHCQTSHYNPECVFSFESSQYEQLPCRTRLSRRVLLSKVKNPSVTDVNVICHYRPKVVQHWSPQSNFLSIAMRESAVWRLLLLLCVCGVILGGVILVLTLICTNAAHGAKSHHNKSSRELNLQHLEEETQISHQRLEQDVDSSAPAIRQDADSEAANAQIPNSSESLTSAAYSLITSAPAVEAKADSQVVGKNMVRRQSSVYHFYCTIPDKPPPQTMDYSYV